MGRSRSSATVIGWNSGTPAKASRQKNDVGNPGPKNLIPQLAAVLHNLNFAETKGRGIRVIRELMAEQGLSSPVLQSDRTGNCFIALLLFHHFLSEDNLRWLRSFEEYNLSEDEMKAMISAREMGAIDNSTYRAMNRETDPLAASKRWRKLCDWVRCQTFGTALSDPPAAPSQ